MANVQLYAQQAKVWAHMGKQEEMQVALDRGREHLGALPPTPSTTIFVVDPAKYEVSVMDCCRHVGNDRLARTLAEEVIRPERTSTAIVGERQSLSSLELVSQSWQRCVVRPILRRTASRDYLFQLRAISQAH